MTFKGKLGTEITVIESLNLLPSPFSVVTVVTKSTPMYEYVCRHYYPYLDRWSSRRDLHGGRQRSDLSDFLRPASRGLCCTQQCKFVSIILCDQPTAGASFTQPQREKYTTYRVCSVVCLFLCMPSAHLVGDYGRKLRSRSEIPSQRA